jgi:hypothetical protein
VDKDKVIKEYMSSLGFKGGLSKSKAKVRAVKNNLAKANIALKKHWENYRMSKRNKYGSFKGEVCSE